MKSSRQSSTLSRADEVRRRKRRSYNVRVVKRDVSYTITEVAELVGIHPQAVRRWAKTGLRTIDDRRPSLVHGSDLIDFLKERQSRRKHKCRPEQFYCCRCRVPRGPQGNRVAIQIRNEKQLNIAGICEACGASMNRVGSVGNLADYKKTFIVQTTTDRRVRECPDPGVMNHFDTENGNGAIQRQE